MKKLYAVVIERTIMVMAESDTEAEMIAERNERAECDNQPDLTYSRLVQKKADIPSIWLDCLPYGGDGKTQCQHAFTQTVTVKP